MPVTRASSSADQEGDPNISRPMQVTASPSTTPNISLDAPLSEHVASQDHQQSSYSRQPYNAEFSSLEHNGYRSLSGIALHAFCLGLALAVSIILTIYLTSVDHHIWRLPQFIATLSIFHFLEFYTTARWNTPAAKLSSYLLFSNGWAYNVAHTCAMVEITLTSLFTPSWQAKCSPTWSTILGATLVALGQLIRSLAMAQAGRSFNHIPARQKQEGHVLVTSGIYAYLRHPSYFGFFWWAVGTQIVVGNAVCTLGYAVVLWHFFKSRIESEEQFLVEFFGQDYVRYRSRTWTWIPLIR